MWSGIRLLLQFLDFERRVGYIDFFYDTSLNSCILFVSLKCIVYCVADTSRFEWNRLNLPFRSVPTRKRLSRRLSRSPERKNQS